MELEMIDFRIQNLLKCSSKSLFIIIAIILGQVPGQTAYKGTIGKAAVELVVGECLYDSSDVRGVYLYKRYNIPIPLKGAFTQHTLILKESTDAEFILREFDRSKPEIAGVWKNNKTNSSISVKLQRAWGVTENEIGKETWTIQELLQNASFEDFFFKIVLSNSPDLPIRVKSLKIYRKKTGTLFQEIQLPSCEYLSNLGINSISLTNFNRTPCISIHQITTRNPSNEYCCIYSIDEKSKRFTGGCEYGSEQ